MRSEGYKIAGMVPADTAWRVVLADGTSGRVVAWACGVDGALYGVTFRREKLALVADADVKRYFYFEPVMQ